MPHLLNISIGPVQEFIASARRCQDLWYGSWLLSELSRAVAESLKDGGAKAVIFPGGLSQGLTLPKDASVANKILVVLDGNEADVKPAADAAEQAMRKRLEVLAGGIFDAAYGKLQGPDVEEAQAMAWDQVRDLMEFQWVAVPYEENLPGAYKTARETAERLLMAAKNTKPWHQPSWARAGWRKSSLDGVRETVIPDRFFDDREGRTKEEHELWLYKTFRVKPTERLCGVGLLKRWGQDAGSDEAAPPNEPPPLSFHSTSHIAAGPLRARAEALAAVPEVLEAWSDYESCLKQAPFWGHLRGRDLTHNLFGDWDGSVLYPSRVQEAFFAGADARHATGRLAEACAVAQAAQKALLDALQVREPNPYYALLLADGDHMGATIDAQDTLKRHQAISLALDGFARSVRTIVTKHEGSLIYAGGDDVLAMLPLHTCLTCAEELATAFGTALKKDEFTTQDGKPPTLSVGIAIAHHLEDFADVRTWAHQAEKLAKQERNSLAIRLEKRGGSPVEATGTWSSEFLTRLRGWIDLQEAGEVPNKLPFQWAELVRLAKGAPDMNALVMREAQRLLARKDRKAAGTKDTEVLDEHLAKLTDPAALLGLINELVLARELARARKQADVPAPQTTQVTP